MYQIPIQLAAQRVGVARTLGLIMILWGCIAMSFVGECQFLESSQLSLISGVGVNPTVRQTQLVLPDAICDLSCESACHCLSCCSIVSERRKLAGHWFFMSVEVVRLSIVWCRADFQTMASVHPPFPAGCGRGRRLPLHVGIPYPILRRWC